MAVHRRTGADHGDRTAVLRRRANRHARRGEYRKAALALRQLAALRGDAASWVALGDMLSRARRPEEAVVAFRRGLWLHRQAGATGRARTVARLILSIVPGDAHATRHAA